MTNQQTNVAGNSAVSPSGSNSMQAAGTATRSKGLSTKVRIEPADLDPGIAARKVVAAETRWFWIGTLPECPDWAPVFNGLDFPKFVEQASRSRDGRTIRIPMVGQIVKLSQERLRVIAGHIARTVIRFRSAQESSDRGIGLGPAELPTPRRKGSLIKIKTPEELEALRKAGLPAPVYEAQPFDEPMSNYVFMIPCADQKNGGRNGNSYPDPISVTGIDWPE